MTTTIRPERPSDYRQVETIHRNAFWNLYVPGADEHYLAHIIRDHADFVPELDLVLERNAQVIGSIMYTKAKLVDENGNVKTILTFGTVAIDPVFQRQSFGKQLMETSMKRATELGYDIIVIFGNPDNYVEHGFKSCQKFNVWATDNTQLTAMLVKVLTPSVLDGRKWIYHESLAMSYDKGAAARFDATFPTKAKGYQSSQEVFYIMSHSVLKS